MDTQYKSGSFTFGFVKPHLVRSGGVGVVKQIIQDSGFEIAYSERTRFSKKQVLDLYPHLIGLFPETFGDSETTVSNISGEVELMVIWSGGEDAARKFRQLIGKVDGKEPKDAETLRGRFALNLFQNAVHGSDSELDALKEIRVIRPEIIDKLLRDDKYRERFYSFLGRMKGIEGNARIEKDIKIA